MHSTISAPAARNGSPGSTTDQSRPASPPTCQKRKRSSVSWLVTSTTFMSESSPALSGGAGQRQLHRRGALAAQARDQIDHDGGRGRADEREPDVAGHAGRDAKEVDPGHDGQQAARR